MGLQPWEKPLKPIQVLLWWVSVATISVLQVLQPWEKPLKPMQLLLRCLSGPTISLDYPLPLPKIVPSQHSIIMVILSTIFLLQYNDGLIDFNNNRMPIFTMTVKMSIIAVSNNVFQTLWSVS